VEMPWLSLPGAGVFDERNDSTFAANQRLFRLALSKHGLFFVGQLHTANFTPDGRNVTSRKIADHVQSFRTNIKKLQPLEPIFINSHSGHDSWNEKECLEFFREIAQIEKEEKVIVYHETHRLRVFNNPWRTRDILKQCPDLKLTADLSHWVCVAERLFDPKIDDDWPEILGLVAERCSHIHARYGFSAGPQIADPADPHWRTEVAAHRSWWDTILETQWKKGTKLVTIEPEHGPPSYQHTVPYTQQPLADIWKVNNWVKDEERSRLASKSWVTFG